MMRVVVMLVLVQLFAVSAFGQEATATAKLAMELTRNARNEREKVDAIFFWITDNISYKTSTPLAASANFRKRNQHKNEEMDTVLLPLDERVAELVLEKGEAVCDGYARLFKVLCGHAGIRAEVVSGYAKAGGGSSKYFRANHSWNAVQIDSSWHLLDATWASGYTNMRGDQFYRHFDSRYYLAPPSQFIRDHYPENPFWSLLPQPPLIREFQNNPFRHTAFIKNQIKSYFPSTGIIEANLGDTVLIEVESEGQEFELVVVDEPLNAFETDGPEKLDRLDAVVPPPQKKKVSYPYVVQSPQVQWLYVVFNGESVLQYRLNIRQPLALTENKKAEN